MVELILSNGELMATVGVLLLSGVSSIISAMFPDKASGIMKVINLLAVNVGNAANDPNKNT